MSIWAAIPQLINAAGGLLRGGAANSFKRLTTGVVTPKAATVAATVNPGGSIARSAVGGAIGAIAGPAVIGAAGSGMVSTGQALQRLSGTGGMMTGVRKRRRAKGITGAELKGFNRVYNFLEKHVEPKLKVKRKRKCR